MLGIEAAEASQGFGKPGEVGVIAAEIRAVADDGVDGAGSLGRRREAIHGAKGGQFVRDRDVEAGQPPGAYVLETVGLVSRGRGQGGVGGLQAQFIKGRLVHDRRQGVAERPADHGVGGAHALSRARSSQNPG